MASASVAHSAFSLMAIDSEPIRAPGIIIVRYTWVERGTVRVECLAQEHNTVSLARARTQTARSGNKRTDH